MAASNGSDYNELQLYRGNDFATPSNAESVAEDEDELMSEAISRLPSQKRSNYALLRRTASERCDTETIDVRKLDHQDRELLVKNALAPREQDNYKLSSAIKVLLDRLPSQKGSNYALLRRTASERCVRKLDHQDRELLVKKALVPSEQDNYKLSSALKELIDRVGLAVPSVEVRYENLNMTANIQQTGSITYKGHKLDEFEVRRNSAYQTNNHTAELTVGETLDFGASFEGATEGFSEYTRYGDGVAGLDEKDEEDRYYNVVVGSEGFDSISDLLPDICAIDGDIRPQPVNADKVIRAAEFAIDEHRRQTGENLVLKRIVRANFQFVAGSMFYITLEASAPNLQNSVYEAKVYFGILEDILLIFRKQVHCQ